MTWDAAGNRVRFTSSTDPTHPYTFVYDPTAGIPAVIEETHDGNSVYYVSLTGSDGSVTDRYTYDVWGKPTGHVGTTAQPYQYVGQLGYYTHYQDPNMAGLLQLGVRFYDPETGRFTQEDPLQDSPNGYGYVLANSIRYVDPWGLTVSDPGTVEYLIPIWGSGRAAIHDFQNQDYLPAIGNTALAASDVFFVKALVAGMAKVGVKELTRTGVSCTHRATRKRLLEHGVAQAGKPLHHWAIGQNSKLGKQLPQSIVNHPLNYVTIENDVLHMGIHGVGPLGDMPRYAKWLKGTPAWYKYLLTSSGGKGASVTGTWIEECCSE